MSEYSGSHEAKGPYSDLSAHIMELAKLGNTQADDSCSARFRPADPRGIDWIFLRSTNEDRQGCTAIIQYDNGTWYDIDFQYGDIWEIIHRDRVQAEGEELDRVLPFAKNDIKRVDYVSNRFSDQDTQANLRDRVGPRLVDPEDTAIMVDILVRKLLAEEDDYYGSAYDKSVDPADLNIDKLTAPIRGLKPEDRVFLFPADSEP